MLKRARTLLLVLSSAGIAISCTRLQQDVIPGEGGTLNLDTLPSTNTVPLSWGRLVSVTNSPGNTEASLLWFEDEAGRVHMVGYDHPTRKLWTPARVITRN